MYIFKTISKDQRIFLYDFVDDNIKDSILKTFNTLWDERDYWKYEPIACYVDSNIVGFVAYTIDENHPGMLKIYYIYVLDEYRGKGIAKTLLEMCFQIAKVNSVNFLFISEEYSDGYKLFINNYCYTKHFNEFNTYDYKFIISNQNKTLF